MNGNRGARALQAFRRPRRGRRNRLLRVTMVLALLIAATSVGWPAYSPPPAEAAAGDLDPSFDGDGKVKTAIGPSSHTMDAVAIQVDGKIVAAGSAFDGTNQVALARYNPNGSLDPSFDGDGTVTTTIPGNGGAEAVAIQADGKIVAAGTVCQPMGSSATQCDFLLVRYNQDGSLDRSLEGDGVVTSHVSERDRARGVAIQSNGAIVVAGSFNAGSVNGSGTNLDVAVIRYRPDGSLDPSFDGDGKVTTSVDPDVDEAFAVVIQPNGRIAVAGNSAPAADDGDFAVLRYDNDGRLDPDFDGDGIAIADVSTGSDIASAIALQPDGKIVAAGLNGASNDWAVTRYNPDGSLDASFDGDGMVTTSVGPGMDQAFGVAIQPDAKLVVAGPSRNPVRGGDDFAVARYNSDGSLDATFGTGGMVRTDFGENAVARGLALQDDGKIVVGGSSGGTTSAQFLLARYLNDPAISINDVGVTEGDGGTVNANFTVSLSSPAGGGGVSVAYATANGSATAPEDYTPASGTVTFGPGETTKGITIPVKGDTGDEPGETFSVNLSAPTNATLPDTQAVGTITDDEPLVIETAAGGPTLLDRLVIRAAYYDVGLSRLCLDPRRSPCINFTASGTGPNPRTEQGVTFEVFDSSGNRPPQTTTGSTGLRGSRLEVHLPPGVPAADLTLEGDVVNGASVQAFHTDGTSAGSAPIPPNASTTVRLPYTPALEVAQQPFAVAAAGDYVYVADPANYLVRFVNPSVNAATACPCETVFAGNGSMGNPADGADPLLTQLSGPYAIDPQPGAPDVVPEMFIADTFGHRLVRVSRRALSPASHSPPGGEVVIETIAGTGSFGFSGDGGGATSAQLNSPYGIAHDRRRNITYVADTLNHRVRAILPNGSIRTVAGNGTPGLAGDGGPATAARLNQPRGLALDGAGNLYIADTFNHSVRRFDRNSEVITTVAGNGAPGLGADGVAANASALNSPAAIALDSASPPNLYIADTGNHRVRRVAANGVVTAVAGTGGAGFSGDDPAPAANAALNSPFGVSVRSNGDVVIADTLNNRVRVVAGGVITTLAGNGTPSYVGNAASGVSGPRAQLGGVSSVASFGSADASFPGETPAATVVADPFNHSVRELRADGQVVTLAGNGTRGAGGDGGPASGAQLSYPFGVALDRSSPPRFLYVADTFNNVVRRIDRTNGRITRVAGDGTAGFSGDGGAATSAKLNFPTGVAVDGSGNLYIADAYNARVRKVDTAGIITTIAGTGRLEFSGDGGRARSAELFFPYAVAADGANPANLYVSDSFNHRVRRVDGDSGVITTVAGNGTPAFAGDGAPGPSGSLHRPWGIALDGASPPNLHIADSFNHRVRRLSGVGERLSTLAADGVPGRQGDLGPASRAFVSAPRGVFPVVPDKLAMVGDSFSNRIRRLGVPITAANPEPVAFSTSSFDVNCTTACPTGSVTVTNTGRVSLAVTDVAVTGPNAGDFSVVPAQNGCTGAKLPRGAACQISVSFKPAADCPSTDPCQRTASLAVSGNGADNVRDIRLTGQLSRPVCFGRPATIVGTRGNDVLVGTSGPDVIHGGDGDDTIRGLDGEDWICAGEGNDGLDARGQTVNGGPGNDHISGGAGDDAVEGDAGDDEIFGDAGNDYLLDGGEGGCCNVATNTGSDRIWGGDGNDILWAADFGNVQADGGAGNDQLYGSQNVPLAEVQRRIRVGELPPGTNLNDTLLAGIGDDGGSASDRRILGGPGSDYIGTKDGVLGNDFGDAGPIDEGDTCIYDSDGNTSTPDDDVICRSSPPIG